MTAAPAPRTWVDGEKPPYSVWNTDLYATWDFLLNPPMVKARQTSAQSMTDHAWVPITYDTEDVDNYGMHSSASNPTRFTAKVPGYYVGYMGVSWTTGSNVGRRAIALRKNGVQFSVPFRADSLAPYETGNNLVIKGVSFGPVYLNGTTDYVECWAFQDSGGAVLTVVGSGTTDYEEQPEFYMRWWSK